MSIVVGLQFSQISGNSQWFYSCKFDVAVKEGKHSIYLVHHLDQNSNDHFYILKFRLKVAIKILLIVLRN